MAELADALDLGSSGATRTGSIPASCTKYSIRFANASLFYFYGPCYSNSKEIIHMLSTFDRKSWIRLIIYGVIFLGLAVFSFFALSNGIKPNSFKSDLASLEYQIVIYGTPINFICLFFLFFSMDFLSPYDGFLKFLRYAIFFLAGGAQLLVAIGSAIVLFAPVIARQELNGVISPWLLSLAFLPTIEFGWFFSITNLENNHDGRGRLRGLFFKLGYFVAMYFACSLLLTLLYNENPSLVVIKVILCYILFPVFYLFSVISMVWEIKKDGLIISSQEFTASSGYASGKSTPMEKAVYKAIKGSYTESRNGTKVTLTVTNVNFNPNNNVVTVGFKYTAGGREDDDDIEYLLRLIANMIESTKGTDAVYQMYQKYPNTYNGAFSFSFREE